MDAKAWVDTSLETMKVLAGAAIGMLYTRLRYRKDMSRTRLGEAEDSGGIAHIRGLRKNAESLQTERDALWAELKRVTDEMQQAKARGEIREARLRRTEQDMLVLSRIVMEDRPHLAPLLQRSGFMAFDESPASGKPQKGK